ncbi:A/G-specific adenine glycosylase [Colletotrichum higginsianum IMI 349063]|uniref:A/G-specific adenine glycosylase n=1 Tax=Colletotrichum higginsianum (strain IMI 349063) TaxID=759273 RepID=A0A1B7XUN7_COLHI|nr:A/G-specific adenine glycosylase [Colletotrichum higginsianum IMI 349063]OBR03475.1 A/G-specific adenine glycosylase [Colletotrichum higginsianum IMI 349063]
MSASSKFDILAVLLTMAAFSSTALASNSNVGNQCAWNPSGPLGLLGQCRAAYNPTTASRASNWGPWTQRPVCVGPKANRGPAYCAFVKEDFRGEAGLLVLTSPEIAAGDDSFVEDFDPRWTGDTGRRPRPAASDAPPFEVREIPGKGLGAVATAAIRAGDVVLREHPALLQLAEPAEALDRTQAIWVLEEGFVRLPRRDQQRIFDLSRSTGGHVLEDIVRTNTFGATFNDVAHFGLFPRVAVGGKGGAAPVAALSIPAESVVAPQDRDWSAITRYSPRTLELEVVAYKNIQPGEEVSISYSMLNMLSDDRKRTLQEWGFNCTCALCGSPAADIAASDARRARLQQILARLTDETATGPSSAAAIGELTAEMDGVVEREGLAAQAGEFYGMVARAYARAGEAGAGARYARMAVEGMERFAGYDDERTAAARGLLGELGKVGGA